MILLFLAMAPGGQSGGGGGGFMAFLPMILIIVIMYLLILRPQAKRQKEHQKMLSAIQKGDKVVTGGGVHGTVVRVNEEEKTLMIKIADNVKIIIDQGTLSRKVTEENKSINPK